MSVLVQNQSSMRARIMLIFLLLYQLHHLPGARHRAGTSIIAFFLIIEGMIFLIGTN